MKRSLLALALLLGCGTAKQPGEVFDAYLAAYAQGDSETMWDLSTPAARLDARRLRLEMMAALADPDPVQRIGVEGTFGITADTLRPMDDKAFFVWALGAIRHRLGAAFVRRTVEGMRFARIEPDGQGVAIIYREASGVESRLPMRKVDDVWRVDMSPFPQPKPQP